MECLESTVFWLSWAFIVAGVAYLFTDRRVLGPYGRYIPADFNRRLVPAALAWFIQELPAFLVPVLFILTTEVRPGLGKGLLLCTYCLHYFQRYRTHPSVSGILSVSVRGLLGINLSANVDVLHGILHGIAADYQSTQV